MRSQKVAIGIHIDTIEKLQNLLREVFIDEECGNLKVDIDGESLLVILTKRRQMLYMPIDDHSVTNAVGKGIFSKNNWNIVNQFSTWKTICLI